MWLSKGDIIVCVFILCKHKQKIKIWNLLSLKCLKNFKMFSINHFLLKLASQEKEKEIFSTEKGSKKNKRGKMFIKIFVTWLQLEFFLDMRERGQLSLENAIISQKSHLSNVVSSRLKTLKHLQISSIQIKRRSHKTILFWSIAKSQHPQECPEPIWNGKWRSNIQCEPETRKL